ncbi:MAG: CRISPR-associated helicase Cas3', partial [Thermomicrobiales bacterium]
GARLFHSRQDIDFDILGIREPDADLDDLTEQAVRVAALDAWSTPIVSCTCDAVLGLIQNNRRGLYSWPALAGAAFVFDEIHAYDDRLFGALLRFISAARTVPMLLMTASLPKRRQQSLEECLRRLDEKYVEIPGPDELETLPRYRREACENKDVISRIAGDIVDGGKVLWICNTVQRAMDAFEQSQQAGLSPVLYHSRFRYADRVKRHQQVVDAFRDRGGAKGPSLAICTQVAEMSLDLKATTLLVTDLAPVPSTIQRLGRLNRAAKPPAEGQTPPATMPFIVIEPSTAEGTPFHLPYTPQDFELTRRWLDWLSVNKQADLSQRDLADAWEAIDEVADRWPAFVPSAWLDGGPMTDVLELRENSPGVTVIREEDADELRAIEDTIRNRSRASGPNGSANAEEQHKELRMTFRKLLSASTIPMPPPPQWIRDNLFGPEGGERRIRGAFVVEEALLKYSPERGGEWQPNAK